MTTREPTASRRIWDRPHLADPHGRPDKGERVRKMFDAIAPTYERVNRLASGGRDGFWRREMARLACVRPGDVLLDVACGTGDVIRAFFDAPVRPRLWVGVDFAAGMLAHATAPGGAEGAFVQADALRLPVRDASVSIVTCAFGVRNFQDLDTGLQEMCRVLGDGGRAVLLEFSLPRRRLMRAGYLFYFRHILPILATWLSRDRTGAYRYLPESVVSFADEGRIRSALASAGFDEVTIHRRTWGIVTIYVACKKSAAGGTA